MGELVSVIIPTKNRELTIQRAVESVLKQTYQDFELIIIDDHSTDHTEEIIRAFRDSRIIYHKLSQSAGAAGARNAGISLSHGKYIAFLDSDDSWKDQKLSFQLAKMHANQADISFTAMERHHYPKGYPAVFPALEEGFIDPNEIYSSPKIGTPTLMAESEILKHNLFNVSLPKLEDYDLSIRLAAKYRIYFINEPLTDAYLQSDSITIDRANEIVALKLIYQIYAQTIWKDCRLLKCQKMITIADTMTLNGERATKEYEEAWNFHRSFKSGLLVLLSRMGMLKFIYNHFLHAV